MSAWEKDCAGGMLSGRGCVATSDRPENGGISVRWGGKSNRLTAPSRGKRQWKENSEERASGKGRDKSLGISGFLPEKGSLRKRAALKASIFYLKGALWGHWQGVVPFREKDTFLVEERKADGGGDLKNPLEGCEKRRTLLQT